MNLSLASSILFGTSCAGFHLRPVDAFIFGHASAPIRRINNANLATQSSASEKCCRVADRLSPICYGPVGRNDEFSDEADNSAQDGQNSDSAEEDEKDTISPEAIINANGDASNSQIIDDVDCYDLCDAFGEEEAVEDIAISGRQQTSASPTKDTPAAAEAVPSAQQQEEAPSKDVKTMRQNLELHWQITSSSSECDLEADIRSCSDPCPTCRGTGRVECRFCGGTGFFTLGEMVMGGGKVCPICNHDGEEECVQCRGSGWVANWRQHNLTGLEP